MMLYRILLCRNGLAGLFLWRQDNNREASNKELFANRRFCRAEILRQNKSNRISSKFLFVSVDFLFWP